MSVYVKSYFHTGADGASGVLFRTGNFPRSEVFKDLFDSQLFKLNTSDSATTDQAGHSRIETNARAILRSIPFADGFTRFTQAHQLPNLYLEAIAGHTTISSETIGHLKLSTLTYLYGTNETRKDYLLEDILSLVAGTGITITEAPAGTYTFAATSIDTYQVKLVDASSTAGYLGDLIGDGLEIDGSDELNVRTNDTDSIALSVGASGLEADVRISTHTLATASCIRLLTESHANGGLYGSLLYDTASLEINGTTHKLGVVNPLVNLTSDLGTVTITHDLVTRTWNLECNCDSIDGFYFDEDDYSIFIGGAVDNSSTNTHTSFEGFESGKNASGSYDIFSGYQSGYSSISNYNIGIGYKALYSSQSNYVIALGHNAGNGNLGDYSIFLGSGMGQNNTEDNQVQIGDSNVNVIPVISADIETGKRVYRGTSTLSRDVSNHYDFSGLLADESSSILEIEASVIAIDLTVKNCNVLSSDTNRALFKGTGTTIDIIIDKYCCDDDSPPSPDYTPLFSNIDEDGYICVFWSGTDLTIKNRTGMLVKFIANIQYADGSIYDDWFLPSTGEFVEIINSVAIALESKSYMTSTEGPSFGTYANNYHYWNNTTKVWGIRNKATESYIIPIRTFIITESVYSLTIGDPGQAGIVFYRSTTGSISTYYECLETDIGKNVYSNIIGAKAGAIGIAIGTGVTNTALITAQTGHTTSGAKDCEDISLSV
jgi:hypothetical protein